MTIAARPRRRARGRIEVLPSGALRVSVYAGLNPVTKQRHYLREVVPAGPKAAAQAEKVRTRLLSEVDDRRSARTNATIDQLLDRYLSVLKIEDTTRSGYERLIRLHIRPVLGALPIGRVGGETVDAFYASLRACRARCGGRPYVEHRTDVDHECDDRCGAHRCRPLGEASLRHIHNVLNGAFGRAVKWRWIGVNPLAQANAPTAPVPDPRPPTSTQAATLAAEAWQDPDWGMFVWLAMTTGARRGELCALRWNRIDFAAGVLEIRASIAQTSGRTWEKDTKTHQRRRIVLDPQTLTLLRAYLQHRAEQADQLGIELADDGFVFSPDPDGRTWPKPDSATQRFARMCARLGWSMHLHQLRHYSATELIAAGVDVRTVAGRLGHGGGGATTLRVYSAWVSEADQRAAQALTARLPELPAGLADAPLLLPARDADSATPSPYQRIADDLRAAIRCGALRDGDPLPPEKDLARRYGVAVSTAHRAVSLLNAAGEVLASRGRRARVAAPEPVTEPVTRSWNPSQRV
jgi:integrase